MTSHLPAPARFNVLSAIILGLTAVAVLIAPGVNAAMAGFALAFATTIPNDLLYFVSGAHLQRVALMWHLGSAIRPIGAEHGGSGTDQGVSVFFPLMRASLMRHRYSELSREAAELVEPRPPASWPDAGAISVEKLIVRYAVRVSRIISSTDHVSHASLNCQTSSMAFRLMWHPVRRSV